MKRFLQTKRILHAVLWILLYVYLVHLGDSINLNNNIAYATPILLTGLVIVLVIYMKLDHTLVDQYKTKRTGSILEYVLLFTPLVVLSLLQFSTGINQTLQKIQIISIVSTMIAVGFIEEVLFRGFLLTSIKQKSNQKRAIIISGVTFGLGHIVNLTRGYDYVELISQIVLAITIGLALAMLFVYTKRLLPGILFHITFNISGSLSIQSKEEQFILLVLMLFIASIYCYYLYRKISLHDDMLENVGVHKQIISGDTI